MNAATRDDNGRVVLQISELRKRSLFIATPSHDDKVYTGYCEAVSALRSIAGRHGIDVQLCVLRGCSIITVARNICVAQFLASSATHFMFIDSDIFFNPDDVMRFLAMDLDVLGGVYPRKTFNFDKICEAAKAGEVEPVAAGLMPTTEPLEDAPETDMTVEVKRLPTGFMMIKREVFTRMAGAGLAPKWEPGKVLSDEVRANTFGFFETGIIDGENVGEDWRFCDKWRSIGGKCHADKLAMLRHDGAASFEASPLRLLKLTSPS